MASRGPSNKQPRKFWPPLAMQQSVWDSIVCGNFIDAKIFAFSRRSREPGRVDTPETLFVNTRVLAAACNYFQSTFSFSDGVETHLNAGLPPGIEHFFDLEECDFDNDFDGPADLDNPIDFGDPVDLDGPTEDDPADSQPQVSPDISESLPRSIKAYVVKYTAYRTLVCELHEVRYTTKG
ncbi:hypothetical protein BDM02DRAFT_3116338 [Thelephora ganbajun]|uniref:Uncharacterized protein n=1 Tax=Thelephora ganbajun TaxID=370292 RepID=A0ACB6ZEI7_THEGA|nr:hypothetical protein BDM02DRAFT_3116338 [Thelephora ganbajun]